MNNNNKKKKKKKKKKNHYINILKSILFLIYINRKSL